MRQTGMNTILTRLVGNEFIIEDKHTDITGQRRPWNFSARSVSIAGISTPALFPESNSAKSD
jgi:hypothetical protein